MNRFVKKITVLLIVAFGTSLWAQTAAMLASNRAGMEMPNPILAMSSSDYPVTAGDVYTLAFAAGSTPVTYTISVDSSYKIRVANLAVINVAGKTFMQLKQQVEEIVTKNYPLSGVQFVLSTPAVFTVTIKGEVRQTAIKEGWALTRLSDVLTGSLTDYSGSRDILITRANGRRIRCDLFKAQRFGELENDPYLQPGDIITVPRLKRQVNITGAVERPGYYELLDGENLNYLMDYYCGGLTDYADLSRVEVTRFNPNDKSYQKFYLNAAEVGSDMELCHHDSVFINASTDLQPVIFVEGAVSSVALIKDKATAVVKKNQIEILDSADASEELDVTKAESNSRFSIRFNPGTNYAFFIRENMKMLSSSADNEHAYIIRNGERIYLDVNKILYDATYYSDLYLEANDTLMIPFKQYYVTVSGAVSMPGRYPYIPDRDWTYYIGLAGGFTDANAGDAITIKDVNGVVHSKTDPITPESNIDAAKNSFSYGFNKYSGLITTSLSIVSSTLSILAVFGVFNK